MFFEWSTPKSGGAYAGTTWLDRNEVRAEADSNGVIQQILVRTNDTDPTVLYKVTVKNTEGKVMGSWEDYRVPDSASTTLLMEP